MSCNRKIFFLFLMNFIKKPITITKNEFLRKKKEEATQMNNNNNKQKKVRSKPVVVSRKLSRIDRIRCVCVLVVVIVVVGLVGVVDVVVIRFFLSAGAMLSMGCAVHRYTRGRDFCARYKQLLNHFLNYNFIFFK